MEGGTPKFDLTQSAPQEVVAYYRSIANEEDLVADTAKADPAKAPRLVFTSETAELISYDGKPDMKPIKGTELLYIANSDQDVLLDIQSQMYYVLFSGRWYTSKALEGKWAYVPSDNLPVDFKKIPPDSPKGDLLATIAGTDQAKDAVLENKIPQTAEVSIDSASANEN